MKNYKLYALIAVGLLLASCSNKGEEAKRETEKKYYRIKQVDKDGRVSYSPVIPVKK